MEQLRDLADARLINGCVYCGGVADTRDHVPSRVFLDSPFPENLPVVPACKPCNGGFSSDEEYVACLIEAAVMGTTNPDEMRRSRVAQILRRQHGLRSRIEASKRDAEGLTSFAPDVDRVRNVLLKLARGHAAFELSSVPSDEPDYLSYWPLHTMGPEDREAFEAPHFPELFGEVGSRGLQRTAVGVVTLVAESGDLVRKQFIVTDWLDVQEGRYRYLAYETSSELVVRIVIGGYLACLIIWASDP